MADIVLTGDTSGSITVAAPAVAGTNTITLPASTGTVLTDTAPKTGNVLQVVNATYSTSTTSSSSTYADTGLSATITPSSISSKILIVVQQSGVAKVTNSTGVNLKLLRNTTDLIAFEKSAGQQYSTAWNIIGGSGATYLDSPSTTSSVTYKTQFASSGNNAAVYVQVDSATSTITLMEIAG